MTEVGVVQLDVLAHQRDGAGLAAGGDAGDDVLPLGQVGVGGNVQLELVHHHVVQTVGVEHQRALVEAGHGQVLDDAFGLDVAEGADLAADVAAHAAVGTEDDDMAGLTPMPSSSLTECCVGFDLCSSEPEM